MFQAIIIDFEDPTAINDAIGGFETLVRIQKAAVDEFQALNEKFSQNVWKSQDYNSYDTEIS